MTKIYLFISLFISLLRTTDRENVPVCSSVTPNDICFPKEHRVYMRKIKTLFRYFFTRPMAVTQITDHWLDEPPSWENSHMDYNKILQENQETQPPNDTTFENIIEKSLHFPPKFPIDSVRCIKLKETVPKETLERNINSAYPVIHEKGLYLCVAFLAHKRKFGSQKEKELYRNMSLLQFVDRLLTKRAVAFVGSSDDYLLLDGAQGSGGWRDIGTDRERSPLILERCLSYDEIKLSALLSVSSFTYFLNNGNRHNRGVLNKDRSKIQESGVIIGMIGPRLSEGDVMEYEEIVKSKEGQWHLQPTVQSLFLHFYGDCYPTEYEYNRGDRYIDLGNDRYFDTLMYSRRISISIDTLLIEANERAKKEGTTAFVHVVGLGLGVWKLIGEQSQLFMETFAERLESLGPVLTNVSDVYFAYISHETVGPYKDGEKIPIENHPAGGIVIHLGKREPHEKLQGHDKCKLLVVSYAWDGNALPGNEFWFGSLDGSSDPAAASSTQVAELHNAHINDNVSSKNLKIVTLKDGLHSFQEYKLLHKY